MLQFHLEKIGVRNHRSGITKILGTVPSCPMCPKYPHSPVHFDFNQMAFDLNHVLTLEWTQPFQAAVILAKSVLREKITLIWFCFNIYSFIVFKSKTLRITIDITCSMIFYTQ